MSGNRQSNTSTRRMRFNASNQTEKNLQSRSGPKQQKNAKRTQFQTPAKTPNTLLSKDLPVACLGRPTGKQTQTKPIISAQKGLVAGWMCGRLSIEG